MKRLALVAVALGVVGDRHDERSRHESPRVEGEAVDAASGLEALAGELAGVVVGGGGTMALDERHQRVGAVELRNLDGLALGFGGGAGGFAVAHGCFSVRVVGLLPHRTAFERHLQVPLRIVLRIVSGERPAELARWRTEDRIMEPSSAELRIP